VSQNARPVGRSNNSSKLWTAQDVKKIGFVGLGAMGIGMAKTLTNAGYEVYGYDVYPPSVENFVAASEGAHDASSPSEAASGAQVLILMVQNAKQAQDVLFGSGKAAEALPRGSVIILNSTVPPSAAREIRQKLVALGRDIDLVDAPVSGGVARAASGQLTVSDTLCIDMPIANDSNR
jgi:3-hydroxyisobutyrate dehydrogenase-like beta-hydroxyacid dehydrogenase